MAPLFPEYELRSLHLERDSDLILARILERGGKKELNWASKHYPLAERKRFLANQGQRLLSSRALRFWSWLWHAPIDKSKVAWRKPGRSYGGIE